ncbi:uncharacterized protein ACNS7B_019329 [Menidia menidia]
MRGKGEVYRACLLFLAVLQIGSPSSGQDSTNTTKPEDLGDGGRPSDVTVAVGEPAVFSCRVPTASQNVTFTFYGSHGNYSLTCPHGHFEDVPQALYGSCDERNGETVAVWTLKGTSFSDNGTRVVCQQRNNLDEPSAVLHVYDSGASYYTLVGCVIGGFFGILLVFGLLFITLQRSKTLQRALCLDGDGEDDMDTIITKE